MDGGQSSPAGLSPPPSVQVVSPTKSAILSAEKKIKEIRDRLRRLEESSKLLVATPTSAATSPASPPPQSQSSPNVPPSTVSASSLNATRYRVQRADRTAKRAAPWVPRDTPGAQDGADEMNLLLREVSAPVFHSEHTASRDVTEIARVSRTPPNLGASGSSTLSGDVLLAPETARLQQSSDGAANATAQDEEESESDEALPSFDHITDPTERRIAELEFMRRREAESEARGVRRSLQAHHAWEERYAAFIVEMESVRLAEELRREKVRRQLIKERERGARRVLVEREHRAAQDKLRRLRDKQIEERRRWEKRRQQQAGDGSSQDPNTTRVTAVGALSTFSVAHSTPVAQVGGDESKASEASQKQKKKKGADSSGSDDSGSGSSGSGSDDSDDTDSDSSSAAGPKKAAASSSDDGSDDSDDSDDSDASSEAAASKAAASTDESSDDATAGKKTDSSDDSDDSDDDSDDDGGDGSSGASSAAKASPSSSAVSGDGSVDSSDWSSEAKKSSGSDGTDDSDDSDDSDS